MAELYVRYSHFNFTRDQWRAAAERYLELETIIAGVTKSDEEVDHDALYEAFGRCDLCDQLHQYLTSRKEFAEHFAGVWAQKALELKKGEV